MAAEAIGTDERRVRRWCVVAALLLLPAAYGVDSWRTVSNLLHDRELFIVRPKMGESADYGGAAFRLTRFSVFADSSDKRLAMPPDRALVLVRLKAKLARDAGDDWVICRLALIDDKGREWDPARISFPTSIAKLVEPDGVSPKSCGMVSLAHPKAGEEVEFGENFVVPRDALPALKIRYSMMPQRPWALEFSTR